MTKALICQFASHLEHLHFTWYCLGDNLGLVETPLRLLDVQKIVLKAIKIVLQADNIDIGDHTLAEWTVAWCDELELYLEHLLIHKSFRYMHLNLKEEHM